MLYMKQKDYVKDRYYSYEKCQHIIFGCLQGLALFLIVYGFLSCICNKFIISQELELKQIWSEVAFCCILITICSSFFSKIKKWFWLVYSVIVGVIAFYCREEIFEGCLYIVQKFLELYNVYFGTNIICGTIKYIDIDWISDALNFIGAILTIICGIDIFILQSYRASIVIVSIYCTLMFIVGHVPDTKYTCMMVLGIVFLIFLGKRQQPLTVCKKKGKVVFETSYNEKIGIQNTFYVTAIVVSLFFIITKTILLPSFIWFENHRELSTIIRDIGNLKPETIVSKVEEIMDSIQKEKPGEAGMGMSGGELGKAESVVGNGETDLIIILEKKISGYIYLKGYVGSIYKENSWKQLPMKFFNDNVIEENSYHIIDDGFFDSKIIVERVNADANYSYIPYFSVIDEKEKEYYLNGWMKGDGKALKEYTLSVLMTMEDIFRVVISTNFNWKGNLEQNPMKDLLLECLEYPEELESIKQEFMETSGYEVSQGLGTITKLIREYLHKKAKYNIAPGATPKDRDFVEYFLTEQKKGYCVHFATSAVMLYRMCGYPARYVEGYVAKVNSTNPTPVKNNTAHAWVEVYLDGVGWIPIEVTPGYTQGNIPSNTVSQSPNDNSEGQEVKPSQRPSQQQGSNGGIGNGNSGNDDGEIIIGIGGNQNGKLVKYDLLKIFIVIWLIFSIIWLIILIRSYILNAERRRRISNGNNRQIVLSLYEFTCRLARKKGILMGTDVAIETMQKRLNCYTSEQLEQWQQIVQKAYFYPEPLPKEERAFVEEVYQSLCGVITKQKMGKIILKYIYCYPKS